MHCTKGARMHQRIPRLLSCRTSHLSRSASLSQAPQVMATALRTESNFSASSAVRQTSLSKTKSQTNSRTFSSPFSASVPQTTASTSTSHVSSRRNWRLSVPKSSTTGPKLMTRPASRRPSNPGSRVSRRPLGNASKIFGKWMRPHSRR